MQNLLESKLPVRAAGHNEGSLKTCSKVSVQGQNLCFPQAKTHALTVDSRM